MKIERRRIGFLVALLALAQVGLIIVSWFLSVTTGGSVRPLLSAEGLRWFCGSFSAMLASPLLVNLLLLSMAWGCLAQSRLVETADRRTDYRQKSAFRVAMLVLVAGVAGILALAFTPHTVLLSATGQLWPSPFSRALVPMLALLAVVVASAYGRASGHFKSFSDVVTSLVSGISSAAPVLVLYVFGMQFYESLRYVFQ